MTCSRWRNYTYTNEFAYRFWDLHNRPSQNHAIGPTPFEMQISLAFSRTSGMLESLAFFNNFKSFCSTSSSTGFRSRVAQFVEPSATASSIWYLFLIIVDNVDLIGMPNFYAIFVLGKVSFFSTSTKTSCLVFRSMNICFLFKLISVDTLTLRNKSTWNWSIERFTTWRVRLTPNQIVHTSYVHRE